MKTVTEKVLAVLLLVSIVYIIMQTIKKRNTPDIYSYSSGDNKVGYKYKGENLIETMTPDKKVQAGNYTIESNVTDGVVTGVTLKNKGSISKQFGKGFGIA